MRQTEKTLAAASAKAAISEKTARKYLKSEKLPSQMKTERNWQTRKNPFKEVWPKIEQMLKVDGSLQALTIFEYLCRETPGQFQEGQLRTLQRKIKTWKAVEGPAREVMFPQVHYPGVQGQSDYTCMNSLGVLIANQPFEHMLYHFVLTYSNWEWGDVCFSESLESLKSGLQNALWLLGGVPKEHRTDNLSAAVNNLKDRKEFNANYKGLIAHYRLKASRNTPGKGHENGDVEQSHYRFKKSVEQELILRGSRNFEDRAAYEQFLHNLMIRRNKGRSQRLAEELKVLGELPGRRLEDYTEAGAKVSRFSTISVRNNIYSVDSRLIGEQVKVWIHAERLEVRYGGKCVACLPRLRGKGNHHINYRHIIDSLVKKPGAFANYKYRQDLFPRFVFRLAYDWLCEHEASRADRDYVRILDLAGKGSEEKVDRACRHLIRKGKPLTHKMIAAEVKKEAPRECVTITQPKLDLRFYDDLLEAKHVG